jgi:hypothetical protein
MEPRLEKLKSMLMADKRFGEYSIEDILEVTQAFMEDDLARYVMDTDPDRENDLVVACIEAAIDNVGSARVSYYASFK